MAKTEKKEVKTIFLTVKQLRDIVKKLDDLYDNCEMEQASFTGDEQEDTLCIISDNDILLDVEFNLHFKGSIWEKFHI